MSFPIALSAIDVEEESRLVGLDQAVVKGRYLSIRDQADKTPVRNVYGRTRIPVLPVLLSSSAGDPDVTTKVSVERMPQESMPLWLSTDPFERQDVFGSMAWPKAEIAPVLTVQQSWDQQLAAAPVISDLSGLLEEYPNAHLILEPGEVRYTPQANGGLQAVMTKPPLREYWPRLPPHKPR